MSSGEPAPGRPVSFGGALDAFLRGCRTTEHEGAPHPLLGDVILVERLGSGGMGVVYRGRHVGLASDVAVKVLPPGIDGDQRAERFQREARLAARLRSPNLVAVTDVGADEASGCLFIVMELVRGAPADKWVERAGAPWTEREALTVCLAACRGLEAAHAAGILHRDVKPGNILVPRAEDGTPDLANAKLADLGLARELADGQALTATQTPLGTPGFLAPEQATNARRAGKSADVFGMGATLYALLTGRPPFAADTPIASVLRAAAGRYRKLAECRPDVSPAVDAIVSRCLLRDPAQRFADASELRAAIEDAIEGRPVPIAPAIDPTATQVAAAAPTVADSSSPPGPRRSRPVATAVLAVLTVGAGVFLLAFLYMVLTRDVVVAPSSAPSASPIPPAADARADDVPHVPTALESPPTGVEPTAPSKSSVAAPYADDPAKHPDAPKSPPSAAAPPTSPATDLHAAPAPAIAGASNVPRPTDTAPVRCAGREALLNAIDWTKAGQWWRARSERLAAVAQSIVDGGAAPPDGFRLIDELDRPMLTDLASWPSAPLPVDGRRDALTHPAVIVNLLAAALRGTAFSPTPAQTASWRAIAERVDAEEMSRARTSTTEKWRLSSVTAASRARAAGLAAIEATLTAGQLDFLVPPVLRGRSGVDLLSPGALWNSRVEVIPCLGRNTFAAAVKRRLIARLRLTAERASGVAACVSAWAQGDAGAKRFAQADDLLTLAGFPTYQRIEADADSMLALLRAVAGAKEIAAVPQLVDDVETMVFVVVPGARVSEVPPAPSSQADGPAFPFPELDEEFAHIHWPELGRALLQASQCAASTVYELNQPVPGDTDAWDEFKDWYRRIRTGAASINKGWQGPQSMDPWTHPAYVANEVAATLDAAHAPLGAVQREKLRAARDLAVDRLHGLAAAAASERVCLRRIEKEAGVKKRFFDAVLAALDHGQVAQLCPSTIDRLTWADWFSSARFWNGHTKMLAARDRESLAKATSALMDETYSHWWNAQEKATIDAEIHAWAVALPDSMFPGSPSALARAGFVSEKDVTDRLAQTLALIDRILKHKELDKIDKSFRDAIAGFPWVIVPV